MTSINTNQKNQSDEKSRSSFLFKNLLRGFIWLAVIIISFVLVKDNDFLINHPIKELITENPFYVYLTFFLSEVIFGLIPPEFFMIWSLSNGITSSYWINVLFLAFVSYGAGIIGYYIGIIFAGTALFKKLYDRFLFKYEKEFRKFSGFILFVGAVTPVPYSAMCMLVGTINYPPRYFYLITLSRILRFIVYGYLIYHANHI